MDPTLSILFDGHPGISFVQGEDRLIQLVVSDRNTGQPIDLSVAKVSVNLPRQSGGVIKRTSFPLTVLPAKVTPGKGVSYTDHGLVDRDAVALVGGSLPAPLSSMANYTAQFIDVDTFGFYDSTGAPVALTSAGGASFTVDASDISINNAQAGQAQLALDANVSAQVNPQLGQDFEVVIVTGGKMRVFVARHGLDVAPQPTP